MSKRVRTVLSLSTSVLVFSAYMAMSTTAEYGQRVLVLPVALFMLMPLAEWLDQRFPSYRRVTTLVTLCYTLSIPLLLIRFALFPTVIALVMYIQAYKLLHAKQVRDYYHIFLMSFFIVVASCVLSPDASIALPLILFLASSVWSFFSLQVYTEATRVAAPTDADIIPLDAQAVDPGRPVRRHSFDAGLIVSSMAITLACILMTAAFFVATPRMEAGVFGGSSLRAPQPVTGLSETVELAQNGPIQRDSSPVMRVQTPDEPNGRYEGSLYWRCTSLDIYSGSGWRSESDPTLVEDATPVMHYRGMGESLVRPRDYGEGSIREVRQEIYLDQVTDNGLPALWMPSRVESTGVNLRWDRRKGDGTFYVGEANRGNLFYTVYSEVSPLWDIEARTPEVEERLRQAPYDYSNMYYMHYGRLTRHNLEPETRELAREITEPYDTVYDKVRAIERYLQSDGGFIYSLDAPPLDLRRPVDHFVQTTRTGHCELFASAMALMLRSLDNPIPTRVVSGYRGGEWDPNDKAWTIRADMAHLWVEVYFVDLGWIPFDPSPAADFTPNTLGSRLEQAIFRNMLKGKMFWYQHVVGYRSPQGLGLKTLTTNLFGRFSAPDPTEAFKRERRDFNLRQALLMIVWAGFIALTLSFVLRRRPDRQRGGRRRIVLSRDQVRAVRLFQSLKKRLRRMGSAPEGKTAEEIIEDLQASGLAPVTAVDVLETYSEVRFGGRPLSRARYQELQKLIRGVR